MHTWNKWKSGIRWGIDGCEVSLNRALLGRETVHVVELPSEASYDLAGLILCFGGVEKVEELERNSKVETTWDRSRVSKATTIKDLDVLAGVGLPGPLDVDSLATVRRLETVKPSGSGNGWIVLLGSTPQTDTGCVNGIVKATDSCATGDRKARVPGVISALQLVVAALEVSAAGLQGKG